MRTPIELTVPACATLGMYDWPEVREATDALWSHLASVLGAFSIPVPERLNRDRPLEQLWLDPGLVLGQTCGFPYLANLQHATTLLGTPEYDVDGAQNGYYQSLIVTHQSHNSIEPHDFHRSILAINDVNSQSGFNSMRLYLADLFRGFTPAEKADSKNNDGYFAAVIRSGSHRASLRAVAEQQADLCAVDPVSFALAGEHEPDTLRQLRIVDRTPSVPALPFICSNHVASQLEPGSLRHALQTCVATLPGSITEPLHLCGIRDLGEQEYIQLRDQTRQAVAAGFGRLDSTHADAISI